MSQYTYQYNNDMEKMKHTPWHIVRTHELDHVDMTESDHRFQIADSQERWLANINKGIYNDESIANLMNAAHDLLEALEAFVTDIEGHPSVAAREHYGLLMAKAKEAIKKARGL